MPEYIFNEDDARDAWLERMEADGLTVDQYINLCPTVAEYVDMCREAGVKP
jgi:hypothetical protein